MVEELSQELCRVVLLVTLEHDVVLTEDLLEGAWVDVAEAACLVPHLEVERCELAHNFALAAKWVGQVDLLSKSHRKEVASETLNVAEAL